MDIRVEWQKLITLEEGDECYPILSTDAHWDYEDASGVYMFCRKYSNKLYPLYIGKAKDIATRIHHQLNNARLMKEVEGSGNGAKVIAIGVFRGKSGQNTDKCIKLVETALIDHAQNEGYNLFNIQGTKTSKHEITYSGNKLAKDFSGITMYRKIRRS